MFNASYYVLRKHINSFNVVNLKTARAVSTASSYIKQMHA